MFCKSKIQKLLHHFQKVPLVLTQCWLRPPAIFDPLAKHQLRAIIVEAWQITGVTRVTRGRPGRFLETSKLIAKIRMGYDGLVAVFNGLVGKSTPETPWSFFREILGFPVIFPMNQSREVYCSVLLSIGKFLLGRSGCSQMSLSHRHVGGTRPQNISHRVHHPNF